MKILRLRNFRIAMKSIRCFAFIVAIVLKLVLSMLSEWTQGYILKYIHQIHVTSLKIRKCSWRALGSLKTAALMSSTKSTVFLERKKN